MKTALLIFITAFSLFAYGYSFGCGGGGGCGDSYQSSCQQNSCSESLNTCQCADVNAGKNPCMSLSQYCRDFGNVGDNQLDW